MRWSEKPKPEWRWKFALKPLNVGGKWVWLERVQWKHKTINPGGWAGGGHGETTYRDKSGEILGVVTEHY